MNLSDAEYEVGGVVFGNTRANELIVTNVDYGSVEWTVQDTPNPVGHNRFFGRDFMAGPTWLFNLATNRYSAAEARDTLQKIMSAWRPAEASTVPGWETTLRYSYAGAVRRVYGRPRRLTPTDASAIDQGIIELTAEFITSDPYSYDDAERTITLQLLQAATGSVTLPAVWPLQSVVTSERQGVIDDVGGNAPAPVRITFAGPVTDPVLESSGWRVKLGTTLAFDQTATIDTRTGTVLRNDGANLAGLLGWDIFLPEVRLNPGPADVKFTGTDPTGTATASLSWNPAYSGL